MKTTTLNMFMAIAMTMTTGMIGRVSSAQPPAGTDDPAVQTRAIDKKVSDLPDHLSTPEAACAAWQRASARKDAQAISQLSWIPLDPAQLENQYRKEEARDAEGFTIYLKALEESKIVEVLIWRNELAQVITHLPFPAGKGRSPFSARTFGCINGQWKNLGEDRLPTLEAARENFTRKKDALWQRFEIIRKNQRASTTPTPSSPPPAASAPPSFKDKMMTLVGDFFRHNFRDITARETLEWGEPANTETGNASIRYKYRATIWGKKVITNNQVFTFTAEGKFVSVVGVYASSMARMVALVEKFFGNNYRDITSRETIEWGEVTTAENGNSSIRYKYQARIWDKKTVTNNQLFTFDSQDKFVSVKHAENM